MKFLAAAIQMLATDDKAANLKEAKHWLRRAAAQGARAGRAAGGFYLAW